MTFGSNWHQVCVGFISLLTLLDFIASIKILFPRCLTDQTELQSRNAETLSTLLLLMVPSLEQPLQILYTRPYSASYLSSNSSSNFFVFYSFFLHSIVNYFIYYCLQCAPCCLKEYLVLDKIYYDKDLLEMSN